MLADADNRADVVLEGGDGLAIDHVVRLAEVAAPLGVTEDDVVAKPLKHRRRYLAGKGALLLEIHGLRAQLDVRARKHRVDGGQRDRWRAEDNLDAAHRHQIAEHARGKVARLGRAEVHLPVARDNGRAITHSCPPPSPPVSLVSPELIASRLLSAATPGNSRPSRNSSEAPPPVETCVTLSAAPAASTAAAEPPPPIIVVAPASVRSTSRPISALVPWANLGNSATPSVPLKMIVSASARTSPKARIVCGPTSRMRQPSWMVSGVVMVRSASLENFSPTATSTGSTKRLPAACAFASSRRASSS